MRLPAALLALAVVVTAAHRSAASRGEQPPAVPSPTQIKVTSENFKTVLHWQYPSMSETPRFIVEIKPYNLGFYKVISTCVNISAHVCDVTGEIDGPFNSHWFRVKAIVGSQQSEYVETPEFIMQRHVPSPTQIKVTSENFKTVLHWQYPSMSETPHFIVEIKPYNLGSYKVISTCVNISAHVCDVTGEIDGPFNSHWFRVKAVVGSQQSAYVETPEFILQRHGKVGPPKLNLSRHGDEIMVDIYHPEFPSVDLLPWIRDTYSRLIYIVTIWDKKNHSEEEFFGDNCTMYKCSLNIPVSAEDSSYCVSAKGSFYGDLMFGEPSAASCFPVLPDQTPDRIPITEYTIILCTVILSLGMMLTICYSYRRLRKENIKLPKSLVSVIRNLNTESILESKSEAKYISVISFEPFKSAVSVDNDEVTSLEVEPQEETVGHENSSGGASSLPPPEAPAKAEEEQESTEEVSSDDEQNREVKESYFISDSGQTDICSNSSGPVVSDKEIQQTVIPSSSLKFSGYDKPHVPLDMLIDVGEEQPVIAYRPPD